jgi:hypothetical protein
MAHRHSLAALAAAGCPTQTDRTLRLTTTPSPMVAAPSLGISGSRAEGQRSKARADRAPRMDAGAESGVGGAEKAAHTHDAGRPGHHSWRPSARTRRGLKPWQRKSTTAMANTSSARAASIDATMAGTVRSTWNTLRTATSPVRLAQSPATRDAPSPSARSDRRTFNPSGHHSVQHLATSIVRSGVAQRRGSHSHLPFATTMIRNPTVHSQDIQHVHRIEGGPFLHRIAEVNVAIELVPGLPGPH